MEEDGSAMESHHTGNMTDTDFVRYLSRTYTGERSYFLPEHSSNNEEFFSQSRFMRSCDLLHHNIRRSVNFDYKKTSPIAALRLRQRRRCKKQQRTHRKLRNLTHLRDEIDENSNVFLRGVLSSVSNMEIQNILWEKNYRLKSSINVLKEENNALKARAWNLSKENRKMKKQIDSWNLERSMILSENKKPYIDSTTMEKVYQDQDFSVVSMKIELNELSHTLAEKEEVLRRQQERISGFDTLSDSLNHEIGELGARLFSFIHKATPESSIELEIKRIQQVIFSNNELIKDTEKKIAIAKQSGCTLLHELEHMEKPVRRYTPEVLIQLKKSAVAVKEEEEEPAKVLASEIKRQTTQINELQYSVQQAINDSLVEKQGIRKRIKEMQKRLAEVEAC